MKQDAKKGGSSAISIQTATMLSLLIFIIAVGASAYRSDVYEKQNGFSPINRDSVESLKAFETVYRVLMSPRCMNCHPAGDVPLQGDDSHLHAMGPKRGLDGKGIYAMKCSNCHQQTNTPGLHTPPGNPDWHLPPAAMKMVFQGKSAHELAKQLVDKKQNGNKNMQQLIEHADDGLVIAGWNPGQGRTLPPVAHAAFKKAWITWIKTGAYAPKQTSN